MKQRLAKVPAPVWVALITIACLAPFGGSAFKIDDTLFLRAAEHIRQEPANFYGFTVNWMGTPTRMIDAFDNPPLTSGFIALASLVAGWSEWALHLAFLLPAVAAALGVYYLAGHYCRRPVVAAIVTALTPVFLVSATTVMCDVTLTAFWVWALYCFERGLREDRPGAFWLAGTLAGLAVLTKFSGLGLCVLLGVYGLVCRRRVGWWLVAMLLPLLFAGVYEWYTHDLYGQGQFSLAAFNAAKIRLAIHQGHLEKAVTGLVFLGGCLLPVLFYAPWLRMRRALWPGLGVLVAGMYLLREAGAFRALVWRADGSFATGLFLQMEAFIAAGVLALALAGFDLWERRDRSSLLLGMWVAGVFTFAAVLNWTVNARSLLPLAPAVGILLARRMEGVDPKASLPDWPRLLVPAFAAAVLSLAVVRADCNFADRTRAAATDLWAKYGRAGGRLWFEGHWGLQYYLEGLGGRALDLAHPDFRAGDYVVVPNDSPNVMPLDAKRAALTGVLEYPAGRGVATFSLPTGASFYAGSIGPLPFAYGSNVADRFGVFQVRENAKQ